MRKFRQKKKRNARTSNQTYRKKSNKNFVRQNSHPKNLTKEVAPEKPQSSEVPMRKSEFVVSFIFGYFGRNQWRL